MKEAFEIKHMIIDDNFESEEFVTADITYNQKDYSVTYKKGDLELVNAWIFKEGTSLPANLPEGIIEALRNDVKNRL